jgi:hypothetical protein
MKFRKKNKKLNKFIYDPIKQHIFLSYYKKKKKNRKKKSINNSQTLINPNIINIHKLWIFLLIRHCKRINSII